MRITRVIFSLFRDEVPPRRLITITLTCCVLLLFIPNFNVLPDRRKTWWPSPTCRQPAQLVTTASNPHPLNRTRLKHRCRLGNNLEIRVDEDFQLFTDWSRRRGDPNRPVCKYQVIYDSRKSLGFELGTWSVWFTTAVKLPRETEYLRVVCAVNKTTVADEFIAMAPARMSSSGRIEQQIRAPKVSPGTHKSKLNFIIVTIDGLSSIDFKQYLSSTHQLIFSDLKSVELKYHAQLGASVPDNIIPLLTGKSENEMVMERKLLDKVAPRLNALLWDHFEREGYLTLSTEDGPGQGIIPHLMKCFDSMPTHYSTLPLMRAVHSANALTESPRPCLRDEASRENFHLGYLRKFFKQFPDQPLFSYLHFSGLNLTDAYETTVLDNDLRHFIEDFLELGHLNNSVLVMTSGDVHQTEPAGSADVLKTPFAFLSLPHWLAGDYPDAMSNLSRNSRSLTTNYDLYETLVDLLHLNDPGSRDAPDRSVGQSLLRELHHRRDCKNLLVPEEFCVCVC